ncbi:MAG: lipase [Moraxellaceae bacterium]|jgi:acetyl esterase|nr:lipase [Moraxellaceae bacterium]
MTTVSLRHRFLQAMDAVASRLPAGLALLPKNDADEPLSPFLEGLRHLRRLTAPRNAAALSPQALRERFRADLLALRVAFPVRDVRHVSIPGAGGELRARHYRPATTTVLPVLLVYFHGGGFVFGDLDTHDDACRLLCQESGMPVLSVDYRLAPEHPFPAAVQDAEAAVRWALENREALGVEAIAVGGDSAGGNLAAVTAQSLAGTGSPLLAQLLVYPGTDRSTPRASHRLFSDGYFLSRDDREFFYHHYLGGQQQLAADPRVSPLLNPAPGTLAPALMVTAGFDMLRDEGEAYAEHLRETGTRVAQMRFERLGHGFINLASVHGDSRLGLKQIAEQWRSICQQQLNRGEKA